MENILDIMKNRRSIRRFKDIPVPKDEITKILEAGSWAPSATNSQPWRFVVVNRRETIHEMAAALRTILAIKDK